MTNNLTKKPCPKCGYENTYDSFWCRGCNTRIIDEQLNDFQVSKKDEEYLPEIEIQKESFGFNIPFLKIFIVLIFFFIVISVFLYFISSFEESINNKSYANYGINPYSYSVDTEIIGKFNEDYWFEENKILTNYGWTFTVSTVEEDYTLDGVVLDMYSYPIDKYQNDVFNIISPVDLFIGVDDIKQNFTNYPFTTTTFSNRHIYVYYYLDDLEANYFDEHVGNNHIIPHNKEVFEKLKNIKTFDKIIIKGDLVNIKGKKSITSIDWLTDTEIGNHNCEIILVDEILTN